jgi:hypothetical protein
MNVGLMPVSPGSTFSNTSAVQRIRESANRVACINNLHQLGMALRMYQDRNRILPIDDTDTPPTPMGTVFTSYLTVVLEGHDSIQAVVAAGQFRDHETVS